jgi:hypothetical protein
MNIKKLLSWRRIFFAAFLPFFFGYVFWQIDGQRVEKTFFLQESKRDLSLCMNDTTGDGLMPLLLEGTSLYKELEKIGEIPVGFGTEKSDIAIKRQGLQISLTLDKKTADWSFLSTDKNGRSCFVAMGKAWKKENEAPVLQQGVLIPIVKTSDQKAVEYSAPFEQIKSDLSKNRQIVVGSGVGDIDLARTPYSRMVVYLFVDDEGHFTTVTSLTLKDTTTRPHEMSTISSVGDGWVFGKNYK